MRGRARRPQAPGPYSLVRPAQRDIEAASHPARSPFPHPPRLGPRPFYHMCLNKLCDGTASRGAPARPSEPNRHKQASETLPKHLIYKGHYTTHNRTRSAEPRAQRERTLPICYSPAGRTWRPLQTVRDAMAEKCRKVIVTAYNFQHGGWTARPGEAGTPITIERRQATQPGPAAPSGRPRRARGRA